MLIQDQIVIRADVAQVWELTVDVEVWPAITPTVTSVERLDDGPLRVGSTARIAQPKQGPRTWTVTRLEPGALFEWETPVSSTTMTGRHRLEQVPDGCRNTLEIELTGRGSRLLGLLARRQFAKAIRTENQGFRRAAEVQADTSPVDEESAG